eukprot:COSAG02_NODE_40059_length_409_cov_1.474194_1_plen_52_part_10
MSLNVNADALDTVLRSKFPRRPRTLSSRARGARVSAATLQQCDRPRVLAVAR